MVCHIRGACDMVCPGEPIWILRDLSASWWPSIDLTFWSWGLGTLVFSAVLWLCHISFTSAPFPARKWMPICVLLRYPPMQSSTRANHLIRKVRFTANMATQHYCFSFTANELQALWAYTGLLRGQRLSGSLGAIYFNWTVDLRCAFRARHCPPLPATALVFLPQLCALLVLTWPLAELFPFESRPDQFFLRCQ